MATIRPSGADHKCLILCYKPIRISKEMVDAAGIEPATSRLRVEVFRALIANVHAVSSWMRCLNGALTMTIVMPEHCEPQLPQRCAD